MFFFVSFYLFCAQKVILGYDCLMTGGELAEAVLALVGVPPQHNSPNRDKYIKIMDDNIITGAKTTIIIIIIIITQFRNENYSIPSSAFIVR